MKIELKKQFIKDVENLPPSYKNKILAIVADMQKAKDIDSIPNIEKLTGYKTFYKIRVGYLRIGIDYDNNHKTIWLMRCMKRGDIYKHFP